VKQFLYSFVLLAAAGCYDLSAVDGKWHTTSNVADWRDEVIYQLLVDRFADGDKNNDDHVDPTALGRYQGGDWQGVIDHLDYLTDLGVTALWISPVVRNVDTDANFDGYHGYWAQDLTKINPHFGDLPKLRELTQKAHARGMKVILDIVTNHMGQLFFYDINGNGVPDENVYGKGWDPLTQMPASNLTRISEYDPDWDPRGIQGYTSLGESGPAAVRFLYLPEIHRVPPDPPFDSPAFYNQKGRIVDYTNVNHQPPDQVLHGDFPGGLKDLDTLNPEVQKALIDAYTAWIDKADFDGFRIDTLKHVEHEFWQGFCPAVRQHAKQIGKDKFFLFGEAFDGDDELVASYTKNGEVDAAFFFPQKFAVIDRVIKYGQEPTTSIQKQFDTLDAIYGASAHPDGVGVAPRDLMVNFLDNHDIPRFLYDKTSQPPMQPYAALHSALAFLFTEKGIPCIYYGTEQQFRGGNDPANRERLWDSNFAEGGETFKLIQRLAAMRKQYRPLRRGDLEVKWATDRKNGESDEGIFAFERVDGGKRALVVHNFNEGHVSSTQAPVSMGGARMKVGFAPGTQLVNVLPVGDAMFDAPLVAGDGTVAVYVQPRGVAVLVDIADQAGIP
jgi:alpha-amylase